jgi:hypothetical protein
MPKFIVTIKEVHLQKMEIEAATSKMARELVAEGDGDLAGNSLYYQTLDPEDWDVEEVKG